VDYGFPLYGPALLAVDYLQRMPVVGVIGKVAEDLRAGEATADLRRLSRKRGWGIVVAAALKASSFQDSPSGEAGNSQAELGLGSLLGDERVPYEADRVYAMARNGEVKPCGCVPLEILTLKNRVGPLTHFPIDFWGERFYPALAGEGNHLCLEDRGGHS
jgi:hypothetical protein